MHLLSFAFASVCRILPAVLQFSVFLFVYMLLLLLALAEEFKWTPLALQYFCCWIHENNRARNLLTLTAIIINFVLASTNMVVWNNLELQFKLLSAQLSGRVLAQTRNPLQTLLLLPLIFMSCYIFLCFCIDAGMVHCHRHRRD